MEEKDTAKEWFVTREGKQFGPVSFDDLRFEMGRGELNPRLDIVWKNGMENWIPAGEVPGLFQKNTEATATVETSNNFTPYAPGETEDERERIIGNWPGVGRGTYFFILVIFPIILAMGSGAFRAGFQGKIEPAMLEYISSGLFLVSFIISIIVCLKRFQNLGMSRWWYLAMYVPFLYPWLQYRQFACPPGYAFHKKLDGLGWVLAFIYWLLFLLIVAAIAAFLYLFILAAPDNPYQLKLDEFHQELKEHLKAAEEAQKNP